MSGRLKVDLDALSDTARSLDVLARQFRNASCALGAARSAVGHPDVAAAMSEFTGNWRRHREALVSSLEAVADMASDSHAAYTEADRELAGKLEAAG